MKRPFPFSQVDVFCETPTLGNPLAVVHEAADLSDEKMAQLAHWTNLSETSFLLPPQNPAADYRVRIYTPVQELPFAGHPTLGSCHAWITNGGAPANDDILQECGIGVIRIRQAQNRLYFQAPPLKRSGPLPTDIFTKALAGLSLTPSDVQAAAWVDNGPGWAALLLKSHAKLMQITPDYATLDGLRIGGVAPASDTDFEVRGFSAGGFEDPVTGSLNAGIAQWLIVDGHAPDTYVAAQGTVLGRKGRVHIQKDGADIWVGGAVQTCVTGTITL
ncbi:PhzF family phenazine biosynthesis protein [Shimia sp.]|uniref:PhzF family phenazine biosynthesis protein n=1 Tax=Shimia sp. TaxID=1954381 RepID=UPI003B8D03A5